MQKTAIVLVPEISLTPQMLDRFISRFGKEKIAVLHSKLSIGEKYDEWNKIKEGKAKGAEHEVVYLREGFVSFSDARIERFVNVWLEDVADLSGSDDEVKLKFPEGF